MPEEKYLLGGTLLLAAFAVGSFLATCVSRSARGVRVFEARRSHCAQCGSPVSCLALVPLLGYVVLGGRCAVCRGRIDPLFPVMEIAAAIVAGSVLWAGDWIFSPRVGAGGILGLALVFLAFHDLRTGRLPDIVTLPMIAAGLGFSAASGAPVSLAGSLAGAALGGGGGLLIAGVYRRLRDAEGLGLGDVKLIAALGAWCGAAALPVIILIASSSALAVLLARAVMGGKIARNARIAFGPYLAAAGWIAWLLAM